SMGRAGFGTSDLKSGVDSELWVFSRLGLRVGSGSYPCKLHGARLRSLRIAGGKATRIGEHTEFVGQAPGFPRLFRPPGRPGSSTLGVVHGDGLELPLPGGGTGFSRSGPRDAPAAESVTTSVPFPIAAADAAGGLALSTSGEWPGSFGVILGSPIIS